MSYVRQLSEVKEADASQIGGKNANLAKLIQAGLPVPSGLAVGLNSFDNAGKLKNDATESIKRYLDNSKLYAVRSSALAEDAEGASWAGQFETFLDTTPDDVIAKVEECHSSAKARAHAYASEQADETKFDVAVVVQEMLKPDYAGVLFTKDPVSGEDQLITEYIAGLGEDLVSGKADPTRIILNSDEDFDVPFDTAQLAELAIKVEELFGVPQDIEWAWANNQIWLVQARPITTNQETRSGYYLGEPDELFYWGPARTKPMYMSDWLAATEQIFKQMAQDSQLPTPPKTLVLFCNQKMVYLTNAQTFANWCEAAFTVYMAQDQMAADRERWQEASQKLPDLNGGDFSAAMIEAWAATIFAEFSLYGAEATLIKMLGRFDPPTRQDIWGAFTVPDKPTFLAAIDAELAESQDPASLAKKYPWIQDGYDGISSSAKQYFDQRLTVVGSQVHAAQNYEEKRLKLIQELGLSKDEVKALTLARQLAEFMDDRKAWMMQTRRLITGSFNNIEHGWCFDEGQVSELDQDDADELWQRYVDFKAATNAVVGIVASNGGKHFINGEVVIVTNPADAIENGKIVVVPSTSPSYVPLMRKAKALITDHGGMMSHAAIVAREFGLPCIVGTKQATKVLQTGDKVVLDLVKGEVNR